jgi:hypothetical protein
MSAIIRAGINHRIQSPGGQITKELQAEIYKLQPTGIGPWIVAPINVHDEIETPIRKGYETKVKELVDAKVDYFKRFVPLIKMQFKLYMKNWGEK